MQVKTLLKVIGAALLISASLSSQAEQAAPATNPKVAKAESMIASADKARKQAASVDGEWRDTGKIIKQAEAALQAGDTLKAMQLAAKAHQQAVLGYQQAMDQKDLQMPSYLRYE